ncbi:MAG: CRTAC1 family protein [Terriglobia bacterium]
MSASPASPAKNHEIFSDHAKALGIDFAHFNGMTGQHYYPEMVGSGAALFDYDNDGDLDALIIQGSVLAPGETLADALFPFKGNPPPRARLFRNDLTVNPDGTRTINFTDVTDQCGINATGYGMGVAVGDYNNDGWPDVYITNFGHNQMWRNNGNGTFTDVTKETGAGVEGWSVSAAFVDFDRDGWLDLFVGQYVNFRFSDRKKCYSPSGSADYCGPLSYDPLPNRLFRNRRDGTFEDVTDASGLGRNFNGALGVVCADFNGDGWPDIFVANDERPNLLWMNQRNGTFVNDAMLAGCALNRDGLAQSGMGVDAQDFDNDGDEDIIVSHLTGEYATLYVNNGKGWFDDRSNESKVADPTRSLTGFGIGFLDYDNDGWLDILIVNGEVKTIEAEAREGDRYPLRQHKVLLHNLGNGYFEDVTSQAGSAFRLLEVGRGAAFGDIDNDGAPDVLVVNNNGPAQLLINNVGQQNHWLGLRMIGERVNRDMLGTRVVLFRSTGPTLVRRVRTDGSYASANDPRVLFGLGNSREVAKVRAYWVDGRIEEWSGIPSDRYTTLREGSGRQVGSK